MSSTNGESKFLTNEPPSLKLTKIPCHQSLKKWPPDCCVAAFVATALKLLGYPKIDYMRFAHELGIRVGPDCNNPWGLPVASNQELRGVSPFAAERILPILLAGFGNNLFFRHIRFSYVTLGLFNELLNEALNKGGIVGIGFNYARLKGCTGQIRHVVRIKTMNDPNKAVLIDDTAGVPPHSIEARWDDIELDVYSVNDGFWIIGPLESMRLEYASPWEGHQIV